MITPVLDKEAVRARLEGAPGRLQASGIRVQASVLSDNQLLAVEGLTSKKHFVFLTCGVRSDGSDHNRLSGKWHAEALALQRLLSHAPTDIANLLRETDQQAERIARLEAALQPFADLWAEWPAASNSGYPEYNSAAVVCATDVQRAIAALEPQP